MQIENIVRDLSNGNRFKRRAILSWLGHAVFPAIDK